MVIERWWCFEVINCQYCCFESKLLWLLGKLKLQAWTKGVKPFQFLRKFTFVRFCKNIKLFIRKLKQLTSFMNQTILKQYKCSNENFFYKFSSKLQCSISEQRFNKLLCVHKISVERQKLGWRWKLIISFRNVIYCDFVFEKWKIRRCEHILREVENLFFIAFDNLSTHKHIENSTRKFCIHQNS